jgi:cytoskeletal protein RodZ
MRERFAQFLKNPLSLLIAFVVFAVIVGLIIWFFTSPRVKNFLGDKENPVATSTSTNSGALVIPILSLPGTTAPRSTEAPQVVVVQPDEQKGRIASGITVTRTPQEVAQQIVPSVSQSALGASRQASPGSSPAPQVLSVATEVRENKDGLTLASLEDQILRSPNVLKVHHITMRGKDALVYITNGEYSHNIAYIDRSKVIYHTSKDYIPAQ